MDKLDFIKLNKLCNKNGRKDKLWTGKIFANHVCDIQLISRICKEFLRLKSKTKPDKTKQTIQLESGQKI